MNNLFYVYVYLDPRKSGTYKYGNLIFKYEPFYIGKGYNDRIYKHVNYAKTLIKNNNKINSPTLNKIKKILINDKYPVIYKLYDNIFETSAFRLEIYLINKIGRSDLKLGPLTNLTYDGEGSSGHKLSTETKMKISKSLTGKISPMRGIQENKKQRIKISIINKGRIRSPATIQKVIESRKWYKPSEETKQKMSHSQIGHAVTEETKEKIRKSCVGRVLSEETKEKISNSLKMRNKKPKI